MATIDEFGDFEWGFPMFEDSGILRNHHQKFFGGNFCGELLFKDRFNVVHEFSKWIHVFILG